MFFQISAEIENILAHEEKHERAAGKNTDDIETKDSRGANREVAQTDNYPDARSDQRRHERYGNADAHDNAIDAFGENAERGKKPADEGDDQG